MSAGPNKRILLFTGRRTLGTAAMERLLGEWAKANNLAVKALRPGEPPSYEEGDVQTKLAVLLPGPRLAGNGTEDKVLALKSALPKVPLIVISESEDHWEALAAARAGAQGYIPATLDPTLAQEAIAFIMHGGCFIPASALNGETPAMGARLGVTEFPEAGAGAPRCSSSQMLTARQQDVLRHLCRGASNKMIARALGMTEATVKVHVRQIMNKFGVTNRTQVVLHAVEGEHFGRESSLIRHEMKDSQKPGSNGGTPSLV